MNGDVNCTIVFGFPWENNANRLCSMSYWLRLVFDIWHDYQIVWRQQIASHQKSISIVCDCWHVAHSTDHFQFSGNKQLCARAPRSVCVFWTESATFSANGAHHQSCRPSVSVCVLCGECRDGMRHEEQRIQLTTWKTKLYYFTNFRTFRVPQFALS